MSFDAENESNKTQLDKQINNTNNNQIESKKNECNQNESHNNDVKMQDNTQDLIKRETTKNVRIICISDTHNGHNALTKQLTELYKSKDDILIHCGDMTNRGKESELIKINEWFGELPYKKSNIFCVSGNMDGLGLDNSTGKYNINGHKLFTNAIYLQHELHIMKELNNLKIFGTPFTPKFVGGFQLKNQLESKKIFSTIPNDIHILISHGPPYNILDKTSRNLRVGDMYLYDRVINVIKPKVMVFGHVHESFGQIKKSNITFINAAQYKGVHMKKKQKNSVQPVVFEFDI
eukprot:452616_1